MCFYVCVNNGEHELQTPRQYNDFFKEEILNESEEKLKDCCLCGWEDAIEAHLTKEFIDFEIIDGDFFVDI